MMDWGYGDPVDRDGDLRAMRKMAQVLVPAGALLLGVPVQGDDVVCQKKHRMYGRVRFPALLKAGGFGCLGAAWDGKWYPTESGCAQMLATLPPKRRRFPRNTTVAQKEYFSSGCSSWRHQPVFELRSSSGS